MAEDSNAYGWNFAHYTYLARGRYAEQLERWFQYFPRDQILVMCSERFFTDTDTNFKAVCRFLGIPEKSLASYPAEARGRNRREDKRAAAFAREYFRPHNLRLRTLLDDGYGWPE
jgi:hypothetical protein